MWRPTDCSVPVGIAFLVLSSVAQFTSAAIFVTNADSSSSQPSHSLGGIDHFQVVYRRYTNSTTFTSTNVTSTSTAIISTLSSTLNDTLSSTTQSSTSTSTGSDTSGPSSTTIPSSTVTSTSLTATSTLASSTTTTSIPSSSLTLTSPPTETSAALAQATSSASSINSEVAILIPIIQSWVKDPENLKTDTLNKVNDLVDGVEDAISDLGGDKSSGCDSNKKRGLLDLVSDVVNTLACVVDDLTEITDKINIDDVVGITPILTDLTKHNDDLEDESEDDDDDGTTTDESETTETKSDPSTTTRDSGTTTTVSSESVTSTTTSGSCEMRETTRLEPPTNTVPTVTVDLPTTTASGETSTSVTATTSDASSSTTSGATSETDTASDMTSGSVSTASGTASTTSGSVSTTVSVTSISTTFSTISSGTTTRVSGIPTTTSALATTTEAARLCIPYQNPHEGDSYCQCSSGDLLTTLPMDGAKPPCQYTELPAPIMTTAPPVTQDPYTFTDPFGNVIACPTWDTFGVGSDITVTTCEEPSSTIFTAGPTGEAKLCAFTGDTFADANCFFGICGGTRHDQFSYLIIPGPDNESRDDDTLLWEDTETDPTEHQPWEFAKDSIGIQEDFSFSWDNAESCSCSVNGEKETFIRFDL
ncbi:hypothetical protein DL768_001484 [Monosporascus sp. mg162]|nr:hypothetical protein DL768_001484 [Monosporascus sp. mg162]